MKGDTFAGEFRLDGFDMDGYEYMDQIYTLQDHAQQFPYTYQGNRKSCFSFNSHINSQAYGTSNPGIFTPALIPVSNTLISIPASLSTTLEYLFKISEQTSSQNAIFNVAPIITHFEKLQSHLVTLESSYKNYLETWVQTSSSLSHDWSITIPTIAAATYEFERAVKERKRIHDGFSWFLECRNAYLEARRSEKMMGQIEWLHWRQILRMRKSMDEVAKGGWEMRNGIVGLKAEIFRLEGLGKGLLQKIEGRMEEEKEKKVEGSMDLFETIKFGKKKEQNIPMIAIDKNEIQGFVDGLENMEREAQRKIGELEGLIGAWRGLEQREMVGGDGGCWFPGILRGGGAADDEDKGTGRYQGWPIDYDETSKDWIIQMKRWLEGRRGLVREVKEGIKAFWESVEEE
ncbi:hypothetical protein DSL72_004561 [Monilinia vaccinii-corymbosi]|uniref:Uncharacterized protein n=1 Tax=Monilinia vaccinii-corymbosi TaxID=61207 RepID=A0A8A3NWZ4_9HELO|nr:hypothetical protein DSL72_004561 [Monilinia vaccinii-corymbosi]